MKDGTSSLALQDEWCTSPCHCRPGQGFHFDAKVGFASACTVHQNILGRSDYDNRQKMIDFLSRGSAHHYRIPTCARLEQRPGTLSPVSLWLSPSSITRWSQSYKPCTLHSSLWLYSCYCSLVVALFVSVLVKSGVVWGVE